MDRGAWLAIVQSVSKSLTQLSTTATKLYTSEKPNLQWLEKMGLYFSHVTTYSEAELAFLTFSQPLSWGWKIAALRPQLVDCLLWGHINFEFKINTDNIFKNNSLFIWLHWVFIVSWRIFRLHCGMWFPCFAFFFSLRMWTLSCCMWDLVLWPGTELQAPCTGSTEHWWHCHKHV